MKSILAVLALAASTTAAAELDVAVTPQELTVGDRAQVTVSLRVADSVPTGAVSWPEWEPSLGSAEILDIGPVETRRLDGGQRLLTQTLDIAFFEAGEATIPPIGVAVAGADGNHAMASEAIQIEIRSVLPGGEAQPQPRPPAPPRQLALGRSFWWSSSALATTLALALGMLWLRTRDYAPERGAVPLLSPRQEFDQSLAALRRESDVESLYSGASMTTRRYLGRSFDFHAPESTTSEIRRTMRQRHLDAELVHRTGSVLAGCDMVKFARRQVSPEAGHRLLDDVAAIADQVEASLVQEPASAADESATRATVEGRHELSDQGDG